MHKPVRLFSLVPSAAPLVRLRASAAALLLVLAGVVVGALAGCSSEPAAAPQSAPTEVGVYTVTTQRYTLTTTLPGRTSAFRVSPVRPQVDGIILKRLFTEGADVKAGQVLYQIDPARYQAAFDSAKAALAQARAAVQSAKPRAARYDALARIDAISKQDRDDAVATLAQNKADVATATANLESARINLDYTRIKAPIAGRIGASSYTAGALVTANQTSPLATIHQINPIYVDIKQTSTQFLSLRQALRRGRLEQVSQTEARVHIRPTDSDQDLQTGTLEFAGVDVNPDTGTVNLRAIVPNPDEDLLPGMYVQAVLQEGVDGNAILLPQQAVARNGRGEPLAWVVTPENKAARKQLTIASAGDNRWRVTSGLKNGDRVIVQGTGKLSVGDKVAPVPVTLGADGQFKTTRLISDGPGARKQATNHNFRKLEEVSRQTAKTQRAKNSLRLRLASWRPCVSQFFRARGSAARKTISISGQKATT